MSKMLAAYLPGNATVELREIERPKPGIGQVLLKMKASGIGLWSRTDAGMDTTTASGALIFHIFAALAAFERELIRERTKAGLQVAAACGRRGGMCDGIVDTGLYSGVGSVEKFLAVE